ncbi:MAG: Spy/CpxP family protein refolding chaperone [Pseudomonadota bacterium]
MSNKKIWNALIAGTAAMTIAGGSLALAQSTPPAPPAQNQNAPADAQRYRATPEDRAAFTDARIAALKAGLKLTAEQEKNWPAVEAAIRDLAKQRADRAAAMRDGRNAQAQAPDAIARLRRAADMATERAAGLKKLADAAEPLYKTLDEGQKHRFAMLMRMGAQGGPGMMDRGGQGPRWHHRRG